MVTSDELQEKNFKMERHRRWLAFFYRELAREERQSRYVEGLKSGILHAWWSAKYPNDAFDQQRAGEEVLDDTE